MAKTDIVKLWGLEYRLVSTVIADVAPAVRDLGIEVKELFVLGELEAHPHPAELADALLMPKPTVTMYLKRLESVGFVERAIDSADLRKHKLSLTAAGRKVRARGLALFAESFGKRLGKLTAAQQAELEQLLEKLL